MLGPLFFLVYVNDLAEGLVSDVRLFADDTSLFSIVNDEQVSADILNENQYCLPKFCRARNG